MHVHTLDQWQHAHNFLNNHQQAEKRTKIVLVLTAVTMIVEVIAGTVFGSMALLADGWHMATHVGAFGITVFAYRYARNHVNDTRYSFGTGKVSVLGGFASAITLAVIALMMIIESLIRLFQPQTIQFNEAIYVAIIGLVVNLASALLLQGEHDHHHGHAHEHLHGHEHSQEHEQEANHGSDHNLRAAYIHVLADALTSVFAIAALFSGKFLGWVWMDATMGLVGAAVIAKWAYGLIQDTGLILLDGASDKQTKLQIIEAIEGDGDSRVTDLHVWHIGQSHLSATISVVTHAPQQPEHYRKLVNHIPLLSHIVVEVNDCPGELCVG